MKPARLLADLLRGVPAQCLSGNLEIAVRGVSADSRTVEPGEVFVCLPGYKTEGGELRADRHEFVPMALSRGAAAVVVERPVAVPPGVPLVQVPNAWAALAAMACAWYEHPSRRLVAVGVTGTSGKTSTTYFLESVLRHAGLRTARFGTIEYRFGAEVVPARQTTPEATELQRLLRRAVDGDFAAVVMEVSSHALELRRTGGVAFDVGVFTNISRDHLNFHPDMQHYLRAKGRLFEELGSGGKRATAVVNADDPASAQILAVNRGAALTYGIAPPAAIRATQLQSDLSGSRFRVHTPRGDLAIEVPHLGEFHIHNALAAVATAVALELPDEAIVAGLRAAPAVPGRFELVEGGQSYRVAVDYAHKPDALDRLLRSARNLQPRRLITVFGCGGDRDRGKRPEMGRIAAELSDLVIVTSDNPRSEPPERIVDEILAGVPTAMTGRVHREPDRALAIQQAIAGAAAGDLVIIAGKGHETYQLFADHQIHFDDREVARHAIAACLAQD